MNAKVMICAIGTLVVTMLVTSIVWSQSPVDEQSEKASAATRAFMRGKLTTSQKILEGLATKKFDMIQEGAKTLQKMSDAAAWKRSSDAVYLHHSREFRAQADKLERLAKERNLDGASFVYMNLVGTCLRCHEHSRDVLRIADIQRGNNLFQLTVATQHTK